MRCIQLQWLQVAATDHSRTLSLDVGLAYYTVAVGISTEQNLPPGHQLTASSGITWADCVYVEHAGAYLDIMRRLQLSPSSINLVPAQVAGKLTVGLASHWPCVTDNSVITTYGLTALGREMGTLPMLQPE